VAAEAVAGPHRSASLADLRGLLRTIAGRSTPAERDAAAALAREAGDCASLEVLRELGAPGPACGPADADRVAGRALAFAAAGPVGAADVDLDAFLRAELGGVRLDAAPPDALAAALDALVRDGRLGALRALAAHGAALPSPAPPAWRRLLLALLAEPTPENVALVRPLALDVNAADVAMAGWGAEPIPYLWHALLQAHRTEPWLPDVTRTPEVRERIDTVTTARVAPLLELGGNADALYPYEHPAYSGMTPLGFARFWKYERLSALLAARGAREVPPWSKRAAPAAVPAAPPAP
jgi:hypothetical protein